MLACLVLRGFFRLLFRLEVRGRARVPASGRILLAANHQSNYDPPLIGCFLPREIFFVAKRQLFRRRAVAHLLSHFNALPIERGGVDRVALKRIRETLNRGLGLLVFPEGHRSFDGRMLPPRNGVGMIAAETRSDVLPVLIEGSFHRPGFLFRRPRVVLEYGEPIPVDRLLEEFPESAPEQAGRRTEVYSRITSRIMEPIHVMQRQVREAGD